MYPLTHLRVGSTVMPGALQCVIATRALRHVRSLLTDDLTQTAACSIIASRLDYCSSILYSSPAVTCDVLQRAQNSLLRVVRQSGGRTGATPLLRSLHWLPVKHRVTYKVASLTFNERLSSTPACLIRACWASALFRHSWRFEEQEMILLGGHCDKCTIVNRKQV